ncbi:MAG: hypothetical protein H0Z53_00885 [Nitrosospira sp.]|nr:hypothetical protein [Nitrosospira sp.]
MTNLKLSQGLEVLRPKADKAFPIPCNEWDVLKGKINDLTTEPWFFHSTGTTLIGAALATLIAIWTGAVTTTADKNTIVIAWAITAVCLMVGVVSLFFAHAERKAHKSKASDVLTQMKLIEQRFEREEI